MVFSGTPEETGTFSELLPKRETNWYLSVKYDHNSNGSSIPSWSRVYTKTSWLLVNDNANAFAMSMKVTSTWLRDPNW